MAHKSNVQIGTSRRLSMLKASVSVVTLLSAPGFLNAAYAQTNVNNGDNTTVTSQADGETITVTSGVTSEVDGSPVIVGATNNVVINNAGTLRSRGVTQTIQFNADTAGSTLTNAAAGVLEGESRVVNIDGDDITVNNSGSILGIGNQRNGAVYANRSANNFSINNLGSASLIDAGAGNEGAGIALEIGGGGNPVTGSIVNEGTIRGRGQSVTGGTAGDGLRFFGPGLAPVYDFVGDVTNSGTISSEGASSVVSGVRFSNRINFSGTLTNTETGTISGVNNGLYFGDADHADGVVNNAGTISSDSRALNIDGAGLTVNNSGSILGTGNQRNGTVYADSTAQDFTLNNSGTVDAGAGNNGAAFSVELADTGNAFTIDNSGSLVGRGQAGAGEAGAGDGIRFERTRVGGALDGSTTGLFTGDVTNSGSITSEATAGTTAGIRFVNGVSFQGTLTNEEGGVISGVNNGLYFGNAVPAGGADHTGGIVNNAGTISSDSRALNIDGRGLEVNNLESGRIVGTGNQRNGTVYSDSTAQDFTFNNAGTVDAGEGNEGSGFAAEIAAEGNSFTLINSGTIQGRGQGSAATGAAGDGVRIGNVGNIGNFTGDITNSGAIRSEATAGTTAGVRFVNGIGFQGTLTNEAGGVIYGTNNGLYFGNPVNGAGADHTGGVVNNAGTITSASRALNIDGIGLVVNNSGTIVGQGNQRNGTVYADSTAQDFTLNNSGTVDTGEGNEGAAFSVELSAEGNDFTIVNSGTIQGRGQASAGAATAGDGLRFERTRNAGALDGTTSGLFTGTITNSGTVRSEATEGTTAGIRFVNGTSFQGTLNNEAGGVIYGTNNGLYFGNPTPAGGGDHTGGVVYNAGTITSASRALNIDGTGLVVNNTGTIVGQGNQRNGTVYADSTAQDFTLNNSGTVDAGEGNEGAAFSVELSEVGNDFTITNSGAIQGRGQASAGAATAGDGLRFERTRNVGALDGTTTGLFTGTITNSGTIRSEATEGTTAGIRFVNGTSFQGTLTNEAGGVIYGTNNGLYFGNATPAGGADHTGGVVNNAGTITSASRAVNIDGNGLVLNNSGTIIGQGDQRNGTVYLDGTANNTTINNSGVIDAGAGNSGSGIAIEALAGTRTHSIVNTGTIQGRGEALASGETAGIRVFYPPNMMRPEVNLTVENMGTIASETSAGILLENVTLTGSISNYGTISGATAAIDTRTSLGNVLFNQRAGSINGDILTGAGDDVVNITGGALNGNIDLGAGSNLVNIASTSGFTVDAARSIASDVTVSGLLNFAGSGSLAVDGDTTIADGSTVGLAFDDVTGLGLGSSRNLLTTTGALSAGTVAFNDASFLVDFDVVTTGNALSVTPTVANLGALSSDANTNAFGSAFASTLAGGSGDATFAAHANAFNAFTRNQQFVTAASAALPSLNNGVTREIYETQNEVLSLIDNRVTEASDAERGVWGQIFGRTADQDGAGSRTLTGYNATALGFVLGADTIIGDASRAGLAFSYADIDVDETGGARENATIESYALSAYYAYEQGDAFINGALSYAFNNADAERLGALGTAVTGEYDVNQFSAKVNAGHTQRFDGFEVTPFASLQYANLSQEDFSEFGGLNLNVDAQGVDFFEGGVGVKFATALASGDTVIKPEVSLGYYYDFVGDSRELNASFAGSNNFNLVGVDPSQSSFEVDASLNVYGAGNVSFAVGYDGEFRSGFSSHGATARLRLNF